MGFMMTKWSRRVPRFRKMSLKAKEATYDHCIEFFNYSNEHVHLMSRFYDDTDDNEEIVEEWCEEHEQIMWKDGLKCSGCL